MFKYSLNVMLIMLCLPVFSDTSRNQTSLIVTTVPPLASLIKTLVPVDVQVKSLLSSQQDPHHRQLKPSQIKLVAKADHVFWLGSKREPQWAAILSERGTDLSTAITNSKRNADPHVWLNPLMLRQMAKLIHQQLRLSLVDRDLELDQALKHYLELLDLTQEQLIQDLQQGEYSLAQMHSMLGHLVDYLDWQEPVTLQDNEHINVSIKQMLVFKAQLQTHGSRCLLVDIRESDSNTSTLLEGNNINLVKLDMLASSDELAHLELLLQIGKALMQNCRL